MADLTDAEFEAAVERGKALEAGPLAAAARYDPSSDRIVVDLKSGCTFSFPPALAQGLGDGSAEQLGRIEISGAGYGLHWEDLDVDLTVPGLLSGIFGTRRWMAELGSRLTAAAPPAMSAARPARRTRGSLAAE